MALGDVVLIVLAVICSLLTVAASVLLVIQFGHPDDKNVALFPKFIVVTGFFLAFILVLAFPLDISNTQNGGSLRMDIVWNILFVLLAIWVLLVVPYAFFFYESDTDPNQGIVLAWAGQAGSALRYTILGFVIFALIVGISYPFLGEAEIPVVRLRRSLAQGLVGSASGAANQLGTPASQDSIKWNIQVSFILYTIAVLSFLGWFFFSVFVGIGFVALPLDLINEYRTRPIPMTVSQYSHAKIAIGKRATQLLEIAREFRKDVTDLDRQTNRKTKKQDRAVHNRLEAEVYNIKNEYKYLEEAYFQKGGNPLVYFAKLAAGLLGIVISLTWIVHICLFLLPPNPVVPFLNTLFSELGSGFPLFGVVAFGIYAYYLLWCTVKGNFRVGIRLPMIMKIYPMELHGTMMNAFLFNVWVILVCIIPLIQFCVANFDQYAQHTEADLIFGAQVQYLKFFQFFWKANVFVYAMLILSFCSLVGLIVCPRNKAQEIDMNLQNILKRRPDN